MNIESADKLVKIVGKKIKYKENGLTYTVNSFAKFLKKETYSKNIKIIYKIELINKSILETNMMDVLGNEDKIIYEFRKFEIVEDVIE